MSDDQQPSFFGGLPPRSAQPTTVLENRSDAEPVSPAGDDKSGLRRILILVGIFVVVVAATLFVANLMITASMKNTTASQPIVGEFSEEVPAAPETPAEPEGTAAAPAEEVAEDGGGSVEGHTVSPELCTAIDGFVAAGGDVMATQEISPELLAATEVLATVVSPNQAVYQSYVNLLKDPTSVANIADAQALSVDFVRAAQGDLVTCV